MRLRCFWAVAAVAFLGCAPTRYVYTPVMTTSAELEGAPAAVYEMPSGSSRGDVRVAMVGVAALRPGGLKDSTLRAIHVALAVSNRSDEHWTVDPSEEHLSLVMNHELSDIYATTAEITRAPTVDVPPGSTRSIDLYFPLPLQLQLQKENKLPSFDVVWTVHTGSRAITQRTPFQRFLAQSSPLDSRDRRLPGDLHNGDPSRPGYQPFDRSHGRPLPLDDE